MIPLYLLLATTIQRIAKEQTSENLNNLPLSLELLGMTPGVGMIADAANVGISLFRGNYADALINLAAMVPLVGQGVTGGKLATKAASSATDVLGATKAKTANNLVDDVDSTVHSSSKEAVRNTRKTQVETIVPNNSLGRIDGTFDAMNPGSLSDSIAGTFAGGRYKSITLKNDTILYRGGSADQPLGQYFSLDAPTSVIQIRIDKAVPPVWPGGAKSHIDTAFKIKIPAGTPSSCWRGGLPK